MQVTDIQLNFQEEGKNTEAVMVSVFQEFLERFYQEMVQDSIGQVQFHQTLLVEDLLTLQYHKRTSIEKLTIRKERKQLDQLYQLQ